MRTYSLKAERAKIVKRQKQSEIIQVRRALKQSGYHGRVSASVARWLRRFEGVTIRPNGGLKTTYNCSID